MINYKGGTMTTFILHDVLIQDTETKKIYGFSPSETTITIVNSELADLTDNEISDIENANELNTSYIYEVQ